MSHNKNNIIEDIIRRAILEDLHTEGDITSNALFSPDDTACAIIRSKEEGILSGVSTIGPVFQTCNQTVAVDLKLADGSVLAAGSVICSLEGPVRAILAGERTALNLLQRLSGIATLTSRFQKAVSHTSAHILDTRKTTPTLRILEKQAVLHGGGMNHRYGLYDMMLIKDTHVKRSGGVAQALRKALAFREAQGDKGLNLKIEIEIQSISEFAAALEFKPDRIMLDNMSTGDMSECVSRRDYLCREIELEASGNINLANVTAVAQTGVDFISIGALTHSAPALDIHLVIQ